MINRKLDQILQEQFVDDGPSQLEYSALSEAQKMGLAKGLMNSAVNMIISKSNKVDYDIIERSKGCFRKCEAYADVVGSIQALKSLEYRAHTKVAGISTLEVAVQQLELLEPYFMKAYSLDSELIKVIYNNMALGVIASTGYLISTSVDMIKSQSGLVEMTLNTGQASKCVESTLLKGLADMNKLAVNGDLQRVFNQLLPSGPNIRSGFTGGDVSTVVELASAAGSAWSAISGKVAAAAPVVFGSLALIAVAVSIRQLVYQFYNMRVKISDYLRINSTFLEMNQTRLSNISNMGQTSKKQQEMMVKLNQLADKIDIDVKSASKKATVELKNDRRQSGETVSELTDTDDLIF